jgi:hypothetical protein
MMALRVHQTWLPRRLAMQLHMDALVAKRACWETLLHEHVSFAKVATSVRRIESTVRASERMYRQASSNTPVGVVTGSGWYDQHLCCEEYFAA